jgi:hypothetical protein
MIEQPLVAQQKKRIFVFARFNLVESYKRNVAPFAGEYRFAFFTDGKARGTRDTRRRFYDAFHSREKSAELTAEDEADLVERCRYMRNIPVDLALRQAHAMALALAEELDRIAPDAVLSQMVDDYVTYLCALLAKKRGIRFVSYAYSYFPGHIQLTQFWSGEPFDVRIPDDEEVREVHEAISQRVFRQHYVQAPGLSFPDHAKRVLRYWLKQAIFKAKSIAERDPLNLHYRVQPYIVEKRRLGDFPAAREFSADWKRDLEDLRSARPGAAVLYMPLGFFPESTIDFWIQNKRILQFEDCTLEMLRSLARGNIILVKEHLHMVGARDRRFYRKLLALEGVVSVHPKEYSNDVLSASDAVILGGGSVGVEATIRGKPVLSYGRGTYWFEPSRATYLDLDEIGEWPAAVRQTLAAFEPLSDDERFEFIRKCLASTVLPRKGVGIWPLIEEDHLRRILEAA